MFAYYFNVLKFCSANQLFHYSFTVFILCSNCKSTLLFMFFFPILSEGIACKEVIRSVTCVLSCVTGAFSSLLS